MTTTEAPATAASRPAPTHPAISCYIRAKNEERLIGRVIEAALQVAQEVVVVDSGSTDRTIEIAEAAGARVVHAAWLGGGKQKRIGEDAARNEWMLDLDADEVVTPALAAEIKALFANGQPPCPVYELSLVTAPPVGEPWWNSTIVYRNRLYDRRQIHARDHAGWDQLEIPPGMAVGKLKNRLLHCSFRDLAQLEAKFNRSSSSRAEDTALKPFWQVALRMTFGRPFYFFHHYIIRGMWRGGWYGFAVAGICAHGRWLKDAKMMETHLKRAQDARRGG